MFAKLIATLGMAQGKQSLPGVKSDPFGSFSHFMGAGAANVNDPLNIFGQSGSNPIKNFLNPAGATLIKGMVPSNQPLPGAAGASPGGSPGFNMQNTGIYKSQMGPLASSFDNYLRAIGQPPTLRYNPSPGGAGGGMSPQVIQQLMMMQRQPPMGGGGGGMRRQQQF